MLIHNFLHSLLLCTYMYSTSFTTVYWWTVFSSKSKASPRCKSGLGNDDLLQRLTCSSVQMFADVRDVHHEILFLHRSPAQWYGYCSVFSNTKILQLFNSLTPCCFETDIVLLIYWICYSVYHINISPKLHLHVYMYIYMYMYMYVHV